MTSPGRLLKAWNLNPNKALGQNFITDPVITQRIVDSGGIGPEDVVLEIGAGLGGLTVPLANTAKFVLAIEKDIRFKEVLKAEILANHLFNVEILDCDILEFDIPREWAGQHGQRVVVAGNLPYNISSQILIQLIMSRSVVKKALVMLQKEPALRMMSSPGSKQYGRLSVMMQYCAAIKKIMDIRPDKFFPRPKIDSVVLSIRFREKIEPAARDELFFFQVIKAAFGQRRKTLKNALKGSELHMDADMAETMLDKADIDPGRRAESLGVDEFVRLSNVMSEVLGK